MQEENSSKRRVTIQIEESYDEGTSSQDSEHEEQDEMNDESKKVKSLFHQSNSNYPSRRQSLIMNNPKKVRPQVYPIW